MKSRSISIRYSLFGLIIISYLLNDIFLIKLGPSFFYLYRLSLVITTLTLLFKSDFVLRKCSFGRHPLLFSVLLMYFYFLVSMFYRQSFDANFILYVISIMALYVITLTRIQIKPPYLKGGWLLKLWILVSVVVILQQLHLFPSQGLGIQRSTKLYFSLYERLDFLELYILLAHLIFNSRSNYIVLLFSSIIVILTGSFTGFLLLATLFLRFKLNAIKVLVAGLLFVSSFYIVDAYSDTLFSKLENIQREKRVESKFGEKAVESNWRLISSIVIIDEVVKNPSVFGRGYNSHLKLVKPYYWNKEPESYASSHTFISILYDQGFLGFSFFLLVCYHVGRHAIALFKRKQWVGFYIGFAVLLRFMFYHQSLITLFLLIFVIIYGRKKSIDL